MATDRFYRPGDFYRICDQTGFKVRASQTKKQWNGLIVRKESREARHPQDLVKGVADYQAVPEPRPRPLPTYADINSIITAFSPAGLFSVEVESSYGFKTGDQISSVLDNTDTFRTTIGHPVYYLADGAGNPITTGPPLYQLIIVYVDTSPSIIGNTLYFTQALPWSTSKGNLVLNWTASNLNYQVVDKYPPSG